MEEPRVVELPAYHVVKLRYEGPPPPDQRFFDHWRRFRELTERLGLSSQAEGVEAIGYAPPLLLPPDVLVYDACLPVEPGFDRRGLGELEVSDVPGGRYVLCAGPVTELPVLLQAAKRYAMSRGLPIERGRIEIYRPLLEGADVTPVAAGYRVHG
jgi:hypothetical protein